MNTQAQIKQSDVRPHAYFTYPHPDVPGLKVTTVVDKVVGSPFNQKVYHRSFEVNVVSPTPLENFCEMAQYPAHRADQPSS